MSQINCPKCGAQLKIHPGVTKVECEYCGYKLDFVALAKAKRPTDQVAPLRVTDKEIEDAARRFMTTGLETPDDLAAAAEITKVDFYYVPTWHLTGDYSADWSASFGYDKKVQRRRYNNSAKRWEVYTETETTWQPHSGTVNGNYVYFCAAVRNDALPLGAAAASLIADVENVSLEAISEKNSYGVEILSGHLSANETFGLRAKSDFEDMVESEVKSHRMGDRQKQWSWRTTIESEENTLFYFPISIVTYGYRGAQWQLVTDGLHADNVRIAGELPKDEAKVELVKNADLNRMLSFLPGLVFVVFFVIGIFRSHPFTVFSWTVLLGFLAALLCGLGGYGFIENEMEKYKKSAIALRTKNLVRRKSMNGELSPEDREAAKASLTPGKCYQPDVKPRWGLALAASVFVFVLTAWPLDTLF